MGRSEDRKYNPVISLDGDEQEPNPAEVVVATRTTLDSFSSTHQAEEEQHSHFAWKDTFYDDSSDDVVAVFDLDYQGILQYHRSLACSWYFSACRTLLLYIIFSAVYPDHPLSIIFAFSFGVYCRFGFGAWLRVQEVRKSIQGGGIHMAVTTTSVRYDQVDPMESIEICLNDITYCLLKSKGCWHGLCSTAAPFVVVVVKVRGRRLPITFAGLHDPHHFVDLIMRLKRGGDPSRISSTNGMVV